MKLAILLTATIKVQVPQGNFSAEERMQMYSSTLRYYSKVIGYRYPIVFLENGAPDKPCGRAVQMLTQKHVAKRYMIAKKVVPLHYESEWQYKYV